MKLEKSEVSRYLFILLLRAPVDALLTVIQATFLKHAFDAVTIGDNAALIKACLLFLLASVCLFSYNSINWMAFAVNTIRVAAKLRKKMMKVLLSHELSSIENRTQGDILTRMNSDTDMAIALFGGAFNIPHFVLAIVRIIVSATFILAMDYKTLVAVLICLIPHVLLNTFIVAMPMKKIRKNISKEMGNASNMLDSMIRCADTALLYDAKGFLLSKFEESSKRIYKENMRIVRRNVFGATLMPIFGAGGYLIILLIGTSNISGNVLSFGELVSALQFRGGVIMGTMLLINCIISIYSNMAGWERVKGFLKE